MGVCSSASAATSLAASLACIHRNHLVFPAAPAVVTEAAVHGLASPIAFVAAIACSLAGVLLRVTAAAAAS